MTDLQATPDVQGDFEAWATVSARLLKRTDEQCSGILSQLGIAQSWPAANASWIKVMCNDMASGHLERVQRYGELCAAELAQRRSRGESAG